MFGPVFQISLKSYLQTFTYKTRQEKQAGRHPSKNKQEKMTETLTERVNVKTFDFGGIKSSEFFFLKIENNPAAKKSHLHIPDRMQRFKNQK